MNKIKWTLREILLNTFKKIFMSRKGLQWVIYNALLVWSMLNMTAVNYTASPEVVMYNFYISLALIIAIQTLLRLIYFEKIDISAHIGK